MAAGEGNQGRLDRFDPHRQAHADENGDRFFKAVVPSSTRRMHSPAGRTPLPVLRHLLRLAQMPLAEPRASVWKSMITLISSSFWIGFPRGR